MLGVHLAENECLKGRSVVWVAHRKELIDQARDRLPPSVNTCTVQSLTEAPECDLLIIDEAHHAVAESWSRLQASQRILGLTATPERADCIGLSHAFEAMVLGPSIKDLISAGHLCPVDVVGPPQRLRGVAEEPKEAWDKWAGDRQGFVFAQDISQSKEIARQLGGVHLDGTTPKAEREDTIARFRSGDIHILCNSQLLTEGFDAPEASACMLARSCGSRSLYLQMVGRVMRTAPGKKRAIVIDLKGVTHQHGLPHDDYDWRLEGSRGRPEDAVPSLCMCPACGRYYMARPEICDCGAEFPVPKPSILEIERARMAEINATMSAEERHAYLVRLIKTARSKGYQLAWAGYRYKARFGSWPKELRRS